MPQIKEKKQGSYPPATERKRIIIVDDEPDFLDLAQDWLSVRYEAITLTNGIGLLEEMRALEPDALILDVRMPEIDGLQLCHEVRKDAEFSDIPILFLTASQSDTDSIRHMFAGGTRYVNKPIGRKELLDTVEDLLK